MTRYALLLGFAAAVAGALPSAAFAEREHEFGMALLQLGFEDLAEKHFTRLRNDSDQDLRLSGLLGLASMKRLQATAAKRANPAGAETLFADAIRLYEDFLRQGTVHPERGTALRELSDIKKERALALVRAAAEEKDADKKKAMLREAESIFDALAAPLGEEAKRARDKFVKSWEDTKKEDMKLMEAAVLTMQPYYLLLLEKATEVYEPDSDKRKKLGEKLVSDLQKELEVYEPLDKAHGVVLWLNFTLGRAYALTGDLKNAIEKGFKPVEDEDTSELSGQALKFVNDLRLATFYTHALVAFELKKYDEAIAAVDTMFMPGNYPTAFDDDRGNAAALIKAKALMLKDPPDYQAALRECQRVIRGGKQPWPNNALQLMADIQGKMTKEERELFADPASLRQAAEGMYQLAHQERDPAARAKRFEEAVRLFEKSIVACRGPNVPYRLRLEHEPESWYELGLCYTKIGLWYEAGFAFEAVIRYFAKDVVGREIAKMPEFKDLWAKVRADVQSGKYKPAEEGQVVDPYAVLFDEAMKQPAVKGLLERLDDRLKKSANNMMVCARKRQKESAWGFDQERYQRAIAVLIEVDPAKKQLLDFHMAAAKNADAEGFFKSGKVAEGIRTMVEAAELFLKAASTQPSVREVGYHMAGKLYYRAMTEAEKLGERAPELSSKTKEFGQKALSAFASYEVHAKDTPPAHDEIEKRKRRDTEVALARPVILMALGRYAEVVKAAEAFIATPGAEPEHLATVTWTRFRAIGELAAEAVGTDAEGEAIERLVKAADECRDKEFMKRFYGAAISVVSATYKKAVDKLAEKIKTAPEAERAELAQRQERYRMASAEWMRKLVDLDPKRKSDFAYMMAIAQVFFSQKAYEPARDMYLKALAEHDPDGDGQRSALAEGLFDEAARKVTFEKEKLTDEVRKKIRSLKELVFGEPESERKRGGVVYPPSKRDWQKAIQVITGLLNEHPKLQCADDLKKVRDELSFRNQLLTVRLNLSDCSRALAKERMGTNPAEAKKLWEEAIEQLEKVRAYWWRDNELKVLQAQCYEALGKYEEAMKLYVEVAQCTVEDSPPWFRAQVQFSRLAFMKGDYEKAKAFPQMLLGSYPEQDIQQYFPDAKEFVAKCEEEMKKQGKKLAEAPTIADVSYEAMSDRDKGLHEELTAIKRRIELKQVPESERETLQRNAFRVHLEKLISNAVEAPLAELAAGRMSRKEASEKQKELLARLIYQPPVTYSALKALGLKLGVLTGPDDGTPIELFSPKAKKLAIEFGLLTPDGKRKPLSEIPEELLKREAGGSLSAEQVPAPPAPSREETREKAPEPAAEEAAP